jgi:hypothetical protein
MLYYFLLYYRLILYTINPLKLFFLVSIQELLRDALPSPANDESCLSLCAQNLVILFVTEVAAVELDRERIFTQNEYAYNCQLTKF